MSDVHQTETLGLGMLSGDKVDALAAAALSMFAEMKLHSKKDLQPHFLAQLYGAAVSIDSAAFAPLLARMQDAGIKAEDIADYYVPAVARKLGDQWCEDEVGFATVTIGVARLQGMLRELGPEWRADRVSDSNASAILIVVASAIYHTLGAMVLAGQLRRRGLSVRLMIGAEPETLGPVMRQARFDAVLISAASGETLESLRRLVAAVKSSTTSPPPVVIGGTILTGFPPDGAEVAALTGADFVTSDPNDALAFCGLTTPARSGADTGQGR